MGIITDTLRATLDELMEKDRQLLEDINQLQADISKTIVEFEEEDRRISREELEEFNRVCAMSEEEYYEYLHGAA